MTFQKNYYTKQQGVLNTDITIIPQKDITVQDIATAVYDVAKDINSTIYSSITDNEHTKELVKSAFDNFDRQCDVLYRNKCYNLNELYIEMDIPDIYTVLPYVYCKSEDDDATIQIKADYENRFIKTDEVNLLISQILHKALDDSCEIDIKFYNTFEDMHEFLDRVNKEHYWLTIV